MSKPNKYATEEQQEANKRNRLCYGAPTGKTWSPLLRYPRNATCFCGSGLKFKKCCIDKVNPVIDKDTKETSQLKSIVNHVKRGGKVHLEIQKEVEDVETPPVGVPLSVDPDPETVAPNPTPENAVEQFHKIHGEPSV